MTALGVSKVTLNGTTLIDITDTTAVASDVADDKYFYTAAGNKTEGTASGGGEPSIDDDMDVIFIDYDGTLLYGYTKEEFAALSAMPSNPTHEGLTSQGWNWTLSDAKAYVAAYGGLDIGQMYTITDGKTRLHISINSLLTTGNGVDRSKFSLGIKSSVANNVSIDWGDGTIETKGSTSFSTYKHTYSATGDYIITLNVTSGTVSLGNNSSSYSICGDNEDLLSGMNKCRIKKILLGANVELTSYSLPSVKLIDTILLPYGTTSIPASSLYLCSLQGFVIPNTVTTIGNSSVYSSNTIRHVAIPNSITSVGTYFLNSCFMLYRAFLPSNVTALGNYTLQNSHNLRRVIIPEGITTIGTPFLSSCKQVKTLIFPSTFTTVNANSTFISGYDVHIEVHFKSTTPATGVTTAAMFNAAGTNLDALVYVPYSADHSVLQAYKSATKFSEFAALIVEEEE